MFKNHQNKYKSCYLLISLESMVPTSSVMIGAAYKHLDKKKKKSLPSCALRIPSLRNKGGQAWGFMSLTPTLMRYGSRVHVQLRLQN